MIVAICIVAAVLAYLALGAFVMSAFGTPRPRPPRPAPRLELVRDERLDITAAQERNRR